MHPPYYYAVHSGNIFRCVQGENPIEACARAFLQHQKDETADEPKPDAIYIVAEFNATESQIQYVKATEV